VVKVHSTDFSETRRLRRITYARMSRS